MQGDTVELILDDPKVTDRKIIGKVVGIFDALTKEGAPNINLEIDIRYGKYNHKWFRYKPVLDGGTLRVLKTGTKHGN